MTQFLGDDVLGALVQLEHFAGALDHGEREAGEARDLDAVAAVGFAGFDFAQEDDVVAGLFDADHEIAHAGRAARRVR